MNRNQTLDITRFIFSLFIIAIHTGLLKDFHITAYHVCTMGMMRIAVPFFFMTSGYYFYQKIVTHQNTNRYLKRLFIIFLVFEMIEIIIRIPILITALQDQTFGSYLWKMISVGLSGVYWYLISLMLSLMILRPFWRRKKVFLFLVIGLLLYVFAMTYDSYSVIFQGTQIQSLAIWHTMIWTWPQAGLCSSLLFLSLGAIFYQYHPQVKHLYILLILSVIMLGGEAYCLQSMNPRDGNCYLSLILATPLLWLYIQQDYFHLFHFDTKKLAQMSLFIYMVHPLVLYILRFFSFPHQSFLFLTTSLISLFMSYFLVKC